MPPIVVNDINQVRALTGNDYKFFVEAAAQLDGNRPPDFHFRLADFLQGSRREWVSKIKKVMGFRLAAKSTVAARWYVAWRWLRNPRTQVLIHSSTEAMAVKLAKGILQHMRSNPILKHLEPPANCSETKFNLCLGGKELKHEQGYSLEAAGISTSLTGSRADLYIFDDPEPEIDPEAARNRIISAFGEALNILHEPGRHLKWLRDTNGNQLTEVPAPERTQLIIIGQPHCITSAYYPTEDEASDDFGGGHPLNNALELVIPAVNSRDEWTWPYMMNRKHYNEQEQRPMTIDEAKKEYTTLNWTLQMMCDRESLALKGAVLKLAHIDEVLRRCPYPVGVIDPADSGECEWGIAIGGTFGNQIHIAYLGGLNGDAYEGDIEDDTINESIWRQIFDIGDEFGVKNWLLEKNLKAAATACRRYLRKTNRMASVTEYASTMNKLRRICNSLEQPVNNGIITASPEVLRNPRNTTQLRGLRYDKLPKPCDRLDALAELVQYLIENPMLASRGDAKPIHRDSIKIAQFQRVSGSEGNPFGRVIR